MPVSFMKPPSPLDRQTLGKYELLSRLSTGGMSEIFLATQKGLAGFRKIVVLKSILPDIRGEEEFVRMFLEEARITSSFNHPNIAQVFDLDTDDEHLFLVMEFIQGATLSEVSEAAQQRDPSLPMGFTLTAVRDTALALHYAHTFSDSRGRKQTVIHRDVSGKNIMVSYDGTTKLLDFGIAKSLGGLRKDTTSIGMVKGTAGYMSPEQVLGEPLDPRSDIFSLGVVLHEALTGARLFARPSEEQEMRAVLNEVVAPPSRSNREVPHALDKVTLKALSLKRDQRFATALEFARAIEAAAPGALWHPEQVGALVQTLHAERLRQTHSLIQQAQGSTGEHSGLHVGDEAPPTVALRPARGITLESPIDLQRPNPDHEETTSPAIPTRAARGAAPTASMRSLAPVPDRLSSEAWEPVRPFAGGLPVFRPDGNLHDTGSRPAVPSGVHPLFADLSFDGTSQLTRLPQNEPGTAIDLRPPVARRTFLAFGAALGVVVVGSLGLWLWQRDSRPPPQVVVAPSPAPVEPVQPAPSEPPVAPPPAPPVIAPPSEVAAPPIEPTRTSRPKATKTTVKKPAKKRRPR